MDAQRPDSQPTSNWTRGVQCALAFLLGVILTFVVGRYFALFSNPRPTERERIIVVATVDINSAGKAELMQLPGVGETTANDILAVRAERGGFESADDLQQVNGLGPKRVQALQPYLRFSRIEESSSPARRPSKSAGSSSRKIGPGDAKIDITRASAAEFETLPGIGKVLSQRIVAAREKAPFRSVEDLRRVAGIGPKTFEKIKPFVFCPTDSDDFTVGSR